MKEKNKKHCKKYVPVSKKRKKALIERVNKLILYRLIFVNLTKLTTNQSLNVLIVLPKGGFYSVVMTL